MACTDCSPGARAAREDKPLLDGLGGYLFIPCFHDSFISKPFLPASLTLASDPHKDEKGQEKVKQYSWYIVSCPSQMLHFHNLLLPALAYDKL